MAQRFLQTVSGVVSTTLDERYPAAIDVSGVEIRDRDVRPPNVNAGRPEQTRFPPQPGGQVQGVRTFILHARYSHICYVY